MCGALLVAGDSDELGCDHGQPLGRVEALKEIDERDGPERHVLLFACRFLHNVAWGRAERASRGPHGRPGCTEPRLPPGLRSWTGEQVLVSASSAKKR